MFSRAQVRISLFLSLFAGLSAHAGPYVPAGDLGLRHDLTVLSDAGIVSGPMSTWPLAWGPILSDIERASTTGVEPGVADALLRVRERAAWETRSQELVVGARLGASDNRPQIRSFQNTPRGRGELSIGVGWLDDAFSVELNGQLVDAAGDDDVRLDDSLLGVVIGNWSIGASTQQRWWGPAWDGSLMLSNNARPIPSVVVDRVFTDPFEFRWLRWLGPWDFNVMFGELESSRHVPNARFFGMRFNFRPLDSLEIGLSRTAQWCGDGRPCDADTFFDLLVGNDNRGDEGIGIDNEPGNQLAGVDFRWSSRLFDQPIAFYGQFIGEDEAGGFPSRWIGQFGGEWSGYLRERWSTRLYAEFSGTSCQFYESSELFNCAYNHGIYETGYRYRGRSIGHPADNDARILSFGGVMLDADDTRWRFLARYGKLNRGGVPDSRNTLTSTPQDIASIDVSHSRTVPFGLIDVGIGYETVDDEQSGSSNNEARFYVQWRSSY
ncbi:MAG: capsule assembly Wzi family protein [Woeseiaceae bacterium]|nr:capsule assembly Wzi family protein [Woeseiaceae bacterium]